MARYIFAPNTRRAFLAQAGLGLLVIAAGCPTDSPKDPDDDPDTGDTGETGDSGADSETGAETGAETGGETGDTDTSDPSETGDTAGVEEDPWGPEPTDCAEPNAETGTGPFYREGAPERTAINPFDEDGTKIRVYFRVVNTACAPIAGCLIEVWHCAPEAAYDMSSDDYRFYGVQTTGADGRGFIETIRPPVYVDDAGAHKPHIHFQFTVAGYRKTAFQCLFLEDGVGPDERNPVLELVEGPDGVYTDSVVFVLAEDTPPA